MSHRVVLFGYGFTGESALQSLLAEPTLEVVGTITPPEVGRYRIMMDPIPVEDLATEKGIPFLRSHDEAQIKRFIRVMTPDSVLVSSYDRILEERTLVSAPEFYNLHHGSLPRERGSSGSEWAILQGKSSIALTLHQLVPELDSGDVFWRKDVPIGPDDYIGQVRDNMNAVIRRNLGKVYGVVVGTRKHADEECVTRTKQVGDPTYTCSVREEDIEIDWSKTTREVYSLIRAFSHPELPRAYTFYKGRKMEVWSGRLPVASKSYTGSIPGKPIAHHKDGGVEILTSDGSIIINGVTYGDARTDAGKVITSLKTTLGLHKTDLLEKITELENELRLMRAR